MYLPRLSTAPVVRPYPGPYVQEARLNACNVFDSSPPPPGRAMSRPCTLQAAATAAYGKWGARSRAPIGRGTCRGQPQSARPGGGEWGRAAGENLLHILILTRLQDRGAHKPDPNKTGSDSAIPSIVSDLPNPGLLGPPLLSRHQLTRPGTDLSAHGCVRVCACVSGVKQILTSSTERGLGIPRISRHPAAASLSLC